MSRAINIIVFGLAFFILLTGFTNAPVSSEAIRSDKGFSDVPSVTLQVGRPAPNFSLQSTQGGNVSLADLSDSAVMLIFFRGSWCPFCVSHMEDITTILPDLEKRGVEVVAISPDKLSGLTTMSEKLNNPYTFLSDPTLDAATAYGIKKDTKLPHPAVVIVDKQGMVKWFYVGEDYKKRPSAAQIMQVVNRFVPQ